MIVMLFSSRAKQKFDMRYFCYSNMFMKSPQNFTQYSYQLTEFILRCYLFCSSLLFVSTQIWCAWLIHDCTVLPVVKFSVHGVTQIPTGDILSRQFHGNHPFLKLSVITPGNNHVPWLSQNFQKWTILPRDTMSPAGICVTPWDTENITTDSTVCTVFYYSL